MTVSADSISGSYSLYSLNSFYVVVIVVTIDTNQFSLGKTETKNLCTFLHRVLKVGTLR